MIINTVEKIYSSMTNEFSCYKVTYTGSNKITFVPLATDNSDYLAIQEWIADGGTVIDNPPE